MYSLVLAFLCILIQCDGTSLSYKDIVIFSAKSKVELSPVQITCSPNDIVVLATPVVNCEDVQYHLHRPNGDITRIYFSRPELKLFRFYDTIRNYELEEELYRRKRGKYIVKYISKNVTTMYPEQMYKILNLRQSEKLQVEEKHMNRNDFMIGPLLEEDHGNWVLSVYCKDIDGEWIEMFQVITITLISRVAMKHSKVTLKEGGTFNLSFMYPINGLETCELTVPMSTIDRYFDRNQIDLDKCGYVVPNITQHDQGVWRVIGVGKIVYEGTVYLEVVDSSETEPDHTYHNVNSNYI